MIGTGTLLNAIGIVAGGIFGLSKTPFSADNQNFSKIALAAFTTFCGLRLTWISLNGSMPHLLKHLGIVLLALVLGKLAGRLLHLQKASNRLGRYARERISAARPDDPDRFYHGFLVCTALFCAAPLGIIGAIQDGLSGYFLPLAAKAFMDGLATMGFISMFGAGVVFSVVPVLVLEGTITLLCARFAQPWLRRDPPFLHRAAHDAMAQNRGHRLSPQPPPCARPDALVPLVNKTVESRGSKVERKLTAVFHGAAIGLRLRDGNLFAGEELVDGGADIIVRRAGVARRNSMAPL